METTNQVLNLDGHHEEYGNTINLVITRRRDLHVMGKIQKTTSSFMILALLFPILLTLLYLLLS